ncbi:hypothetical protein [Nevskia sp.]|uniref:hypothetical protein n=1 Tax=Nevskia sp. TaxID=1929292 RepID=UPI0025E24F0D|nr:hypothetical protein [Nevskia sp.]
MQANEAFDTLTGEARREAIADIARTASVSDGFAKQVLLGVRTHPCSAAMSEVVSTWFRGRGIEVSPAEATGIREATDDRTTAAAA